MKILKTTKNERHYTETKIIFRLAITSYQIHESPEDNGIIYIRWRCMRSGQGNHNTVPNKLSSRNKGKIKVFKPTKTMPIYYSYIFSERTNWGCTLAWRLLNLEGSIFLKKATYSVQNNYICKSKLLFTDSK